MLTNHALLLLLSYVAQTAWILNATVRDNILFGQSYDPIKYKKAVEASQLVADLAVLPQHDLTEIGERGTVVVHVPNDVLILRLCT